MTRIRIDDLPVAENLTPEQEALIIGAGPRSFRPMLEELERREVPAALAPGIDLTANVLTIKGFDSSQSFYTNSSTVSINEAGQLAVSRGLNTKAEVNPADVMKIVYLGGSAPEKFTNLTNIASEFSNMGGGDKYSTVSGFNLTSTFKDGRLPDSSADLEAKRNGQLIGGKNEAPPLEWTAHPDAQSYAVVTKDISVPGENPSDPKGTHIHQALYNIPKDTLSLSTNEALSTGAGHRFRGPNPPDGNPHTYVTTVYALRTADLDLRGMTPEQMEEAIKAQSVGQTSISGTLQADVRPDVWDAGKNTWKT
jgi:phosphatidylethanolamine-binding protein (PEBP) family uncharacterized protein